MAVQANTLGRAKSMGDSAALEGTAASAATHDAKCRRVVFGAPFLALLPWHISHEEACCWSEVLVR